MLRSDPDTESQGASAFQVLKRLSSFARPHWAPIAATLGFALLSAGFQLFRPWPLKFILDSIITKDSLSGTTLWLLVGILVVVVLAAAVDGFLSFKQTQMINLAGRTIVFDLRSALFERVQRMSLQMHSRRQSGDMMTRFTTDVKALKDIFTDTVVSMVYAVVYLIGMAVVLLWLDWQLGLLAMLGAPFLYLLLTRYTREIRRLSRVERRREGALASVLHETLGAMRLTHIFDQEGKASSRFREESYASLETGYEATMAGARFGWTTDVVRSIITALVVGFGVVRVMDGAMTAGELFVVYSYIRGFYRPMRTMIKEIAMINRSMARAERVAELLDSEEGVVDTPHAKRAPAFRGEVAFRNVTFAYEEGRPALRNIDVVAPAGEVTAFVGPTGAGKTTLASLIPRLYDPSEGSVEIDGTDIREYKLKSLRAQISMVLQESVLFRASIGENIAYGRPNATQSEIIEAARAANVHDFIETLPEGYETEIGERGETLSGGQRQRIAVARAMIRDAPILILDEPLVGLDIESQEAVLEALERLMEGRTVILITHQLSTVQRANNAVVLEQGEIVQQGPVRELAAADGRYRTLVEAELGDALASRA